MLKTIQKRDTRSVVATKISMVFVLTVIFVTVAACSEITFSNQPTNPPPTGEINKPPQESASTTITSTPLTIPPKSPTEEIDRNIIDQLPPDTYIIYQGISDLYAVSSSTLSPVTLARNIDSAVVSSNGKYIFYWSAGVPNKKYILDITKKQAETIELNLECRFMSISPTGDLGACGNKDIYIFSLDGKVSQLITWSESGTEDTWDFPVWSPDSRWLAYQNLGNISPNNKDGLYLTDLQCLSRIEKCKEMTYGPLIEPRLLMNGPSSVSWSPDSNFLAVPSVDSIQVLNISTKETTLLTKTYGGTSISWSPDGDWIAFTSFADNYLYIIPSYGGDVIPLHEYGDVVGWIVVP